MLSQSVLPEFIRIGEHNLEIIVLPDLKCRGVPCDSRVHVRTRQIFINADVRDGRRREVLDAAIVRFAARCAPPAASLPVEEVW